MKKVPPRALSAVALAILIPLCLLPERTSGVGENSYPIIAVVDFGYSDTSGEPKNQLAEHEARLKSFIEALRADLSNHRHYRVIAVSCTRESCTGDEVLSALTREAQFLGARYILFGGIHKMSTLVQWAKAQIIDVTDNKVVFDRLLTFRGDTDEAWQRAERFLVQQIEASDFVSDRLRKK
jgi:hypothetical protein